MLATILYAEIYLFCFILLSLVLFWARSLNANSASGRWFRLVLGCYLCNYLSNFLFTLFNGGILPQGKGLFASYFFKSCYFLSLSLGVYCWCGYTETDMGNTTFQDPAKAKYLLLPLAVPVLLILTNFRSHLLFGISAERAYIRGPHFHVLMLFLAGCSIFETLRILSAARRESDPVRLGHRRLMCTFPLCLLAAWILSFVGERMPVICVCITLQLLCVYVGSTNQQVSLDKLTQVNNRQNLTGYLSHKLRTHTDDLCLLMMDLDFFKEINDTYGHLEGDAALVRVANALKLACTGCRRRPFIARYGGDEFIIAAELREGEVDDLCQRIRQTLDRLNTEAGAPYPLQLSIGCAKWSEGMTYTQLIGAADAELYKIKKGRTGSRR